MGHFFRGPWYMIGVGFNKLARTPVAYQNYPQPQVTFTPPPPPPPRDKIIHIP